MSDCRVEVRTGPDAAWMHAKTPGPFAIYARLWVWLVRRRRLFPAAEWRYVR